MFRMTRFPLDLSISYESSICFLTLICTVRPQGDRFCAVERPGLVRLDWPLAGWRCGHSHPQLLLLWARGRHWRSSHPIRRNALPGLYCCCQRRRSRQGLWHWLRCQQRLEVQEFVEIVFLAMWFTLFYFQPRWCCQLALGH